MTSPCGSSSPGGHEAESLVEPAGTAIAANDVAGEQFIAARARE